jgi:glycosyltransferase involved in cell wall biosynthesis
MPVHNALPYLDEAIESILDQTFADFEFVILDDASTDGSTHKLREWASRDRRIRLLEVEDNLGPVLSSERAAQEAIAPIVARMDADDISHPDRLDRQIQVLRENSDVGLVACLCDLVDSGGRQIRGPDLWRLARRSWMAPFPHGAIMYRRGLFDRVGGYRRESELWEDQDLVTRMAAVAKIMVIPQPLYRVRQTAVSTRFTAGRERQERAIDSMYRQLPEPGKDKFSGNGKKVDPRVFLSLGSVILWSGGRPRLFTRLIRHGELSANPRILAAIAWTAWASASPRSLRTCLRMVAAGRNLIARSRIDLNAPFLWSQPAGNGSAAAKPPSTEAPARARRASASATRPARSRKASR